MSNAPPAKAETTAGTDLHCEKPLALTYCSDLLPSFSYPAATSRKCDDVV